MNYFILGFIFFIAVLALVFATVTFSTRNSSTVHGTSQVNQDEINQIFSTETKKDKSKPSIKELVEQSVVHSKRLGEIGTDVTIVTGASSNHFKSMIRFIESAQKYAINANLVVYDLGLTPDEIQQIKGLNHVTYEHFDFSKYPSWMDITKEAGQYAWKPIIVRKVCEKYGDMVIWCDGGNIIRDETFRVVVKILEDEGLYSAVSDGNIEKWTHPKTLEYLGVDPSMYTKNNRNGALIAVNNNIKWAKDTIYRWEEMSNIKNCIAPEGSSRANHRQDQAVFSCLYYQTQADQHFQNYDSLIGYSVQNDNPE